MIDDLRESCRDRLLSFFSRAFESGGYTWDCDVSGRAACFTYKSNKTYSVWVTTFSMI